MKTIIIEAIIFFLGVILGVFIQKRNASKDLPSIEKLDIGENDTLILSYPNNLSVDQYDRLNNFLKHNLPENLKGKIIIFDNGAKLSAITKPNSQKI